ncbi:hypothetical protein B0J17DRAFT_632844 [Rhizoctonia solani]|nr:hypothetical protein B0J17DRAFT_632844 [Rhizoctonia solani]
MKAGTGTSSANGTCWRLGAAIFHAPMLDNLPETPATNNTVITVMGYFIGFCNRDSMGSQTMVHTSRKHPYAHQTIQDSKPLYLAFSSLAFDMVTTFSKFNARQGILLVVWQVIWASAAPLLILIVIIIVDGYLSRILSGVNLINSQGYILQQFERGWATPSPSRAPPRETWFRKPPERPYYSEMPVMHVTVYTEEIELTVKTNNISRDDRGEESVSDESKRELLGVTSLKLITTVSNGSHPCMNKC